jgi:ribokinase
VPAPDGGAPRVTVVGSVNLDLVAQVERLPRAGETVTDAVLARIPGGKGANQAVAAARLGARVAMIGCVGDDSFRDEALAGLVDAGVDLTRVRTVDGSTGVALVTVAADGENTIVVTPGANARLTADDVDVAGDTVTLAQLEVPQEAVARAAEQSPFLCLNAAPAKPLDLGIRAALVVVNELELEAIGDPPAPLVAVTRGAEGAVLLEDGREVARARPPAVHAVDGTGAGDAFCAQLALALGTEVEPELALRRACAAGALAASRLGAQPSLPTAAEVDAVLAT